MAEIYHPIEPTVYGRSENRIKALKVVHLPKKTDDTLDTEDLSPQIFIKGISLRYYVDGTFYDVGGITGDLQQVTEIGNATSLPIVAHSFDVQDSDLNIDLLVSAGYETNGIESGGVISFKGFGTNNLTQLKPNIQTANRTLQLPNADGTLATSVNGVSSDAAGNINIGTGVGSGSRMTTVTSVAALQALSGANWDYVILKDASSAAYTGEYWVGNNGIYQYNASSGDFTATGGGFWKRQIYAPLEESTSYNVARTVAVFNRKTTGYGGTFSASRTPQFLMLRTDDLTDKSWGGLISGNAGGGAIKFMNDFSNTGNWALHMGNVDNNFNFTSMIEAHYSNLGSSAIFRVNMTPSTALSGAVGTGALPFGVACFGGLLLGYVIKTSNYTTTSTDFGIDVDATSVAISITLGAFSTGKVQVIRKFDTSSNAVTIIGTINGVANYTLTAQGHCVMLQYNGAGWNIVNTTKTTISTSTFQALTSGTSIVWDRNIKGQNTTLPIAHNGTLSMTNDADGNEGNCEITQGTGTYYKITVPAGDRVANGDSVVGSPTTIDLDEVDGAKILIHYIRVGTSRRWNKIRYI